MPSRSCRPNLMSLCIPALHDHRTCHVACGSSFELLERHKSFRMHSYEKRAHKPFGIHSYKIIALKVSWNELLQKIGAGDTTLAQQKGRAVNLTGLPGANSIND